MEIVLGLLFAAGIVAGTWGIIQVMKYYDRKELDRQAEVARQTELDNLKALEEGN
jgi:hypothetical protein